MYWKSVFGKMMKWNTVQKLEKSRTAQTPMNARTPPNTPQPQSRAEDSNARRLPCSISRNPNSIATPAPTAPYFANHSSESQSSWTSVIWIFSFSGENSSTSFSTVPSAFLTSA